MYINDVKTIMANLELLYSGALEQRQTSDEERSYYHNSVLYEQNPDVYSSELEEIYTWYDEQTWLVKNRWDSYS